MSSATDFGARAASWDDDPKKLARAEAIADAIARAVSLQPTMRSYEYGAGTGLVSFALADRVGAITLADSSRGMIDVAQAKIAALGRPATTARVEDLLADELPTERFDLIHSAMTLHHIPDTATILARFHGLLAPGGYLCIADLDGEDGSFHGLEVDVHHGFDRAALGELLRAAGFDEVRFDTAFVMPRETRSYPVFLASARRPPE